MKTIHYALQTHDRGNRDPNVNRYCGYSKHELIKKCVTSFFLSVEYAANFEIEIEHVVNIIDDHSSQETIDFLNKIAHHFNQKPNIKVEVTNLVESGIMKSVEKCYSYLKEHAPLNGLVYQVQDDYLFEETAIYEMMSIFIQVLYDTKSHSVITTFNDPYFWNSVYRYKNTPRTLIPGEKRYWLQTYDAPCSFLTSGSLFLQNYDLYEKFVTFDSQYQYMEKESIHQMFLTRGILGLVPITSVALHMQGELFMDPYIDWKQRWDSIPEIV